MRTLSPAQLKRVEALFADIPSRRAPGCAIGLARAGEPLLAQGFGLASIEQDAPITPDTGFRIASVSKHFTVAAALLLQAQGRLGLQDPVGRHLDGLPDWGQVVRIEHLMRNTSGLPDFLELLRLGGVGMEQRLDRAAMLDAIRRSGHLNFEPGSRFLYCNSNFLLLGLIVERLAGQRLDAFLQTHLLGPAGLVDTAMLSANDNVTPGLAAPYLPDPAGGYKRALHGFEHGGEGGLVSSVKDLLRWSAALLQPDSPLAALADPSTLSGGQPSPYARGLEHSQWLGRDCVGHGGLWPGYRTEFLLMPAEQLVAVVISNDAGRNPYKLARELLRIALDEADAPTPQAPPAGSWFDGGTGQLIELFEQGGLPMARQWGVPFELREEQAGRWLPQRGAYEFELRHGDGDDGGEQTLLLELGAGRCATLQRLLQRAPLPADLRGSFFCADIASRWRIEGEQLRVEGPLMRAQSPWTLRGIDAEWVELQSQGYGLQPSQMLRIERSRTGAISGLLLDSARVKALRFTPC